MLIDETLRGPEFSRAYAALVDRWLAGLLGDETDVALVAIGGYGRGQLAPGSDLDLILVHEGRRDVAELAQRIWYPIWDAGLKLDHSVKTVKEAIKVAAGDLKASLGLLDARAVAGDASLAATLRERAHEQWRRTASKWLPALDQAVQERHASNGDVAFLLEPDLKEGRGGLRDATVLQAVAIASPVTIAAGDGLRAAVDSLLGVRVELHRARGRATDHLRLQDQAHIADVLGYANTDEMMRAVSAAARTIAWASDDTWRRVRSWLRGPSGRGPGADRELSPGVVVRDNTVVVRNDADLTDPSLPLRVAEAAALTETPIAPASLERLRDDAAALGTEPWPRRALDALLACLATGHAAIPALEAIDQYELLVRALPEWRGVRCRPQHNPYHRYTVDRHLLEAAAQAAALGANVSRPDMLLLAALLHDIGKGSPGDHTTVGVELTEVIATRMGVGADDVDTLLTLVRHHLLLGDTATRRDIQDPATIEMVASRVENPFTLQLLAALTEADALATGDAAWTPWRRGLIHELVAAVDDALAGHAPVPRSSALDPRLAALVDEAEQALLLRADDDEIIVVAPDESGLFSQLAGVLSLHGLDILSGEAHDAGNGMAVDVFRVEPSHGRFPPWDKVRTDIERAIDGALALEARLAQRAAAYAGDNRYKSRTPPETGVTVDNWASRDASIVEVRAANGVGVLYRIARVFAQQHVDVRYAKVLTLGHEVVDTFYVLDPRGRKLDEYRASELERALLFELTR